jgi:hypothetical protein
MTHADKEDEKDIEDCFQFSAFFKNPLYPQNPLYPRSLVPNGFLKMTAEAQRYREENNNFRRCSF